MKGWYGQKQRHALASKGVRSVKFDDKTKRYEFLKDMQRMGKLDYDMEDELAVLEIEMDISHEIDYVGQGSGQHGTMDRSYDEYIFRDANGNEIEVIQFTEPDWDGIRDVSYDERMNDEEYEAFCQKEEREFYKEGEGEIHVIWAGALDFTGTEREFAQQYPDLNRHLGLGLKAEGLGEVVLSSMLPYFIGDVMESGGDKKKK